MSLLLLFAPGAGSEAPAVAGSIGSSSRLMLLGVSLLGYVVTFLG